MASIVPIAVDFTVEGDTLAEIHLAAVNKMTDLIANHQAVEEVNITFGNLKPIDMFTWEAEVSASIMYDEDKVTNALTTDEEEAAGNAS